MKILVDMNLSPLWVKFFGSHGIEARHWSEIGKADTSDSEIFDYASVQGFVVFTHDLDFGTLLALRHVSSPSVVQIRMHDVLPYGPCGPLVVRCLRDVEDWLSKGALVTVDIDRHRIRLLPI